jgi:hypothetical protein
LKNVSLGNTGALLKRARHFVSGLPLLFWRGSAGGADGQLRTNYVAIKSRFTVVKRIGKGGRLSPRSFLRMLIKAVTKYDRGHQSGFSHPLNPEK